MNIIMGNRVYKIFLGILALINAQGFKQETDWALQDLAYIHEMVIENHPGMYNQLDPEFKNSLESNFAQAKHSLTLSNNNLEKMHVIENFMHAFHDAHVYIHYPESHAKQTHKADSSCADKSFGITQCGADSHWVSLPTFQPNKEQEALLRSVTEAMADLRSCKLIVFDIRGNGGGNSEWARGLVLSLFGQDYARPMLQESTRDVYVEWRASKGNLEHMRRLQETNKAAFDAQSSFMQWMCKAIEGLQLAVDAGLPYFTERSDVTRASQESVIYTDIVKAHIVVVIDNKCVSAALDFIDYLKAMEHPMTLVGTTTKADSLYMECRSFDLPSKRGNFCLPIKVYRNRPRGHNQPYVPDIEFVGDTSDVQALLNNYFLTSASA